MKTLDEAVGVVLRTLSPDDPIQAANVKDMLNDIYESPQCKAGLLGLMDKYIPSDTPSHLMARYGRMVRTVFAIGLCAGKEMERD